jgi:SAM-dependent methyltransferase
MDTHSFKKRIAELYQRHFVDRVHPHLDKIYSLFKSKPDNWDEKEEGGHSENRYKYFEKDRVNDIVDIVSRSFTALSGEKKLRILDLGCGFGEYSAIFRGFGHDVYSLNGGNTWYLEDFRYVCEDILDLKYEELNVTHLYRRFYKAIHFDYVWASEILTLDSFNNQTEIETVLTKLHTISDNIIVVCHKDRILEYDHTKFSPEIHRNKANFIDIITFYSNDEYKVLAERLAESGKKFGHYVNIIKIKDEKQWGSAVCKKPLLINERYCKFGSPLLYLDADCEIIKPLDKLIQLIKENDICIRERNLKDRFNLGVMGFGTNESKLKPLLLEWHRLTHKSFGIHQTVDQKPLASLLAGAHKKVKVHKLHPYYNFLPADHLDYNKDKAVILHHKESKTNDLARAWRNKLKREEDNYYKRK